MTASLKDIWFVFLNGDTHSELGSDRNHHGE